ncbi:MAG: hypothetical protein WC846_04255 [Candidatus Gracilibacteria bacterium]|jgi:hypothetical protein
MADDSKNPKSAEGENKVGGEVNGAPKEVTKEASKEEENSPDLLNPEESKNALKEFAADDLFQVEDMPESNELSERRKKTKNRLNELAKVDNPAEDGAEIFGEEGGLMDLLRESKLSGKHIKFCCGGLLVMALFVGAIYGAVKGYDYFKGRVPPADQDPGGETASEDSSDAFTDVSLWSGILVGGEEVTEDGTTVSAENIGENFDSDEYAQFVGDFGKMYNAMQVNVNELLDKSTDRTATLDAYIKELQNLRSMGGQNLARLTEESDQISSRYNEIEGEKSNLESQFFDKLKALDGYASTNALEEYIVSAQNVVRLRAEYLARQKLIAYYENVIADMELRSRDVELNREALIKGVQVVDIKDSDINLIIDESQL